MGWVPKYNNKYKRAVRMKPVDINFDTDIEYGIDHNPKIRNTKFMIISEYENAKIFLKKPPNWSKDVFVITKAKSNV